MSRSIQIDELPDFDVAEYLDTPETIALYLNEIIREGDSALLAAALGSIARAHGMTNTARRSGLTREALYKALRPGASPRFDTILKVLQAMDVELVARPKT